MDNESMVRYSFNLASRFEREGKLLAALGLWIVADKFSPTPFWVARVHARAIAETIGLADPFPEITEPRESPGEVRP